MVRCPSCGANSAKLGEIPAATVFAGRTLSPPLSGGDLFCCLGCSLWFRWPQLTKAKMDELYAAGCDDTWEEQPANRPDWILASEVLAGTVPGSVLDVGCFDGGFLSTLGPDRQRYGIEIQPEAADKARRRGVNVIGSDFSAINGSYNAIVAFDVIEHVTDPAAFLRQLVDSITPAGMVIISTGNTRSWWWRLVKGNYWYCQFPEHISFINPGWCTRQAKQLGVVATVYRFSRFGRSLPEKLRGFAINVLYRILPALKVLGLKPSSGKLGRLDREGPPVGLANDHMLVTFQKTPSS